MFTRRFVYEKKHKVNLSFYIIGIINKFNWMSTKFSEEKINDAKKCVEKKFKDSKGCNLTKLWYDEEKSNNFIKGYLKSGKGSVNGVEAENVIVLLSNFDVDSSGGDGSLNPNSTYSNWNWILIWDSKTGNWQVDDWGY